MNLSDLPYDVLVLVCNCLCDPCDVAALRATCTRFRDAGLFLTTAVVCAEPTCAPWRRVQLVVKHENKSIRTLVLTGSSPEGGIDAATDTIEACAATVKRLIVTGECADALLVAYKAHAFWAAVRSCARLESLVVAGAIAPDPDDGAPKRGAADLALPARLKMLTISGLALPPSKQWDAWVARLKGLRHLALVSSVGLVWDLRPLTNLEVLILDGTLLTFKDFCYLPPRLAVLSLHSCPVLLVHTTGYDRAAHLARLAPTLTRFYRGPNPHQTALTAGVKMSKDAYQLRDKTAIAEAPFIRLLFTHDANSKAPFVELNT